MTLWHTNKDSGATVVSNQLSSSLAACSSAPSSAQPAIEIDNSDVWDIEAGISWVRE